MMKRTLVPPQSMNQSEGTGMSVVVGGLQASLRCLSLARPNWKLESSRNEKMAPYVKYVVLA